MKISDKKPVSGLVKSMRDIRDEMSKEISDMSFLEERTYLDELLGLVKDSTSQKHAPVTQK